MISWPEYKTRFSDLDKNIQTFEINIDPDNYLVAFMNPGNHTLYFGFLVFKNTDLLGSAIEKLMSLANQHSAEKIVGPLDGSTWNNYRFIENQGFSDSYPGQPILGKSFLEIFYKFGFIVEERYLSKKITDFSALKKLIAPFARLPLPGISMVTASRELLSKHKQRLFPLINQVFNENFEFRNLNILEFDFLFQTLVEKLSLEHSVLAFAQEAPIGFIFNYFSKGNLYLKTAGVSPEHRNQGLTLFQMIAHVASAPSQIHNIFVCLMRENNFPSLISDRLTHQKNSYVLVSKKLK